MDNSIDIPKDTSLPLFISAGQDRSGAAKILGISQVDFKVTARESSDLFMVEITLLVNGGPARHVHHYQDEWFYIVEGEFIIEAGSDRFLMTPGDSLFVLRNVPHVWAFIAGTRGRMIASVSPAGNLEDFFIAADKNKALPGPDQSQWQPYGMEWIGPPLKIE